MAIARGTDEIDESEIYDLLRNDRRRQVLKHLRRSLGSMSLRNLARRIASEETGESPPPKNIKRSVYNSLHQTHLPKLDRQGVVQYDKNRKVVSLGDGARNINRYLDMTAPFGLTWGEFYRTIGTVGLLAVLLSLTDVPVISAVPPVLLATVFLAVIAFSTVAQLWRNRWFYLQFLA
jgi:hypothetical protein